MSMESKERGRMATQMGTKLLRIFTCRRDGGEDEACAK